MMNKKSLFFSLISENHCREKIFKFSEFLFAFPCNVVHCPLSNEIGNVISDFLQEEIFQILKFIELS